jgi:pyridoxamine 5'-phosphate oxidase
MNLHDLPTAIEDPLESLLGFHRRVERQLAALCRLPVHLEVHGVDPGASASAASIASFFANAVPLHHADEELNLLPLLEQRLADAAETDAFRYLRQRLEGDHRDMDEAWRRLRRPLEAIGEGIHRKLPESLVHYFRALHSVHITSEEAGIHMLAVRRLHPEDHATLARRMLARRTVMRSSRN